MRRTIVRLAVLSFAVLGLALGWAQLAATREATHAAALLAAASQFGDSQCVTNVPRAWGQYRGGSAQSGLSFEDSAGTLRFVTNLPCGATPTVALEIRRTGNAAN
jgi:hypothetical protein